MIPWLLACGPAPPPEPGVRIERAVALDRDRAWADVVTDEGQALRCLVVEDREERCFQRAPRPSGLRRLGRRLLDVHVSSGTELPTRTVEFLDPATGLPGRVLALGFDLREQVHGDGLLMDGPDGTVLAVANRGLAGAPAYVVPGADPAGVEDLAAFALEAWGPEDQPRWRRSLGGVPDEAWIARDRVVVHAGGLWRIFNARTGTLVALVPGVPGACVDGGVLWTVGEGAITRVELGPATVTQQPFAAPGWVASCVLLDGEPVFHGGLPDARGWLQGPAFPRFDVPRVDLALHDHVTADGRWWVMELNRGLAIVDPRARTVVTEDGAHSVVGGVAWFEIAPDRTLLMTIHLGDTVTSLPARITPLEDHVADGVLWSFPLRAPLGGPMSTRLPLAR